MSDVNTTENTTENSGFFAKLKQGLTKTKDGFVKNMDYVFGGAGEIDEEFYEDLEEILITGDLGVQTTEDILDRLRSVVARDHIREADACREALVGCIRDVMEENVASYAFEEQPSVVLVVGVNGVGKTTTIGKLAAKYKNNGKRVIVAAADTFRAAAGAQLKEWTDRAGVDFIGGTEGGDPGAVVYDALQAAKARNADVLLVDTAGRLHNKKNLMEELSKINRIIDREYPDAYRETLVVLDATTGQNALSQAKEFSESTGVTGIVLTKMDGSARGGIAVAIAAQLAIPVKYIGVGEGVSDLEKFNATDYVRALFS